MVDTEFGQHLKEVWKYVSTVKTGLIHNNRFFTDEEFINRLEAVFEDRRIRISTDTILYRGRIYTNEDKFEKLADCRRKRRKTFAGYGKKESFVNLESKWAQQGRMNPEGITCLYTAIDPDTCIKELSPGFNELISVAKIKLLEELIVVDLSNSFSMCDDDFARTLSVYIQDMITQGGNNNKDYVFPQFIAEVCKALGYDGISYRSKYFSRTEVFEDKGINLAIFNHKKCTAISSSLYRVESISIESRPL